MLNTDDALVWHQISDEQRRARKEHRCFCNGTIKPGMTYRRMTGTDEDGAFRVHIECITRPDDCWEAIEARKSMELGHPFDQRLEG